jgi:hypothetical protein
VEEYFKGEASHEAPDIDWGLLLLPMLEIKAFDANQIRGSQ